MDTAGDTIRGEVGEATCRVIVKCLEMVVGAVRTAEAAMGVGAVGGWAETTMVPGAFPPVEVELWVEVVVAAPWK
jgi:hypothetical protein